MAKPARSPLLGYNHNVKYGGHIFHVQTEDSGPGNPHVFTHLFFEGSILASKRGQYEPDLPEDEVRAMMQAQHKAILKELKQPTTSASRVSSRCAENPSPPRSSSPRSRRLPIRR